MAAKHRKGSAQDSPKAAPAQEAASLPRRRHKITALATLLPPVLRPALLRRGFALPELVTDWTIIAGPLLAEVSVPEKLIRDRNGENAVLVVRVSPAVALQFQHDEPQILERINSFFGFNAVSRLRLRQAPLPPRPVRPPPPPPLVAAEKAAIADRLTGIEDAELRDRLARLGETIRRYDGSVTRQGLDSAFRAGMLPARSGIKRKGEGEE